MRYILQVRPHALYLPLALGAIQSSNSNAVVAQNGSKGRWEEPVIYVLYAVIPATPTSPPSVVMLLD